MQMPNQVQNFSLNLSDAAVRSKIADFTRGNLRVGTVDVSVSAQEAARLSEKEGYEVLIVRGGDSPMAVFFPGYLRDLLPSHPVGQDAGMEGDMLLSEIIERIDAAGIDFHSEQVNYYPSLRMCPEGHITSDDPCPRHAKSTAPYP
jgi:hypothetical protein